MDRSYFDEKKELSIEGTAEINFRVKEISDLVNSCCYDFPDVFNPTLVHDQVRAIKSLLDEVRINFEKIRWASTQTNLQFNEWLIKHGHSDLIIESP